MKAILKLSLTLLAFTALLCGHSVAAEKKPLQVFILAGQSNMQGHAKISTFEHIGMDPATKPMLAEMLGADGKPKVCERVWISSIGCAETEQTGKLTAGFGADDRENRAGVHVRPHHAEVHGRAHFAHQDLLGRQELEHGFPPAERRAVRVQ